MSAPTAVRFPYGGPTRVRGNGRPVGLPGFAGSVVRFVELPNTIPVQDPDTKVEGPPRGRRCRSAGLIPGRGADKGPGAGPANPATSEYGIVIDCMMAGPVLVSKLQISTISGFNGPIAIAFVPAPSAPAPTVTSVSPDAGRRAEIVRPV